MISHVFGVTESRVSDIMILLNVLKFSFGFEAVILFPPEDHLEPLACS